MYKSYISYSVEVLSPSETSYIISWFPLSPIRLIGYILQLAVSPGNFVTTVSFIDNILDWCPDYIFGLSVLNTISMLCFFSVSLILPVILSCIGTWICSLFLFCCVFLDVDAVCILFIIYPFSYAASLSTLSLLFILRGLYFHHPLSLNSWESLWKGKREESSGVCRNYLMIYPYASGLEK